MRLDDYEAALARRHGRLDAAYLVLAFCGSVLLVAALATLGFWLDVQWIRWAAGR